MSSPDDVVAKNKRLGLTVFLCVFFMLGLAFASVPLYRLFCQVTGFDGTTQVAKALPDRVLERTVRVRFDANTHRDLPWEFKPEQRDVRVKLGQKGLTSYRAKNLTARPLVGTAVYNVTPFKAGKYFNKIACFCFGEQHLAAGEQVSMPVLFFIDPAMADDPDMEDVKTITLSYNFYKTQTKALEDATEAFYDGQ